MIREALVDNLLINEESSLKSRTRNYAVLSEAGNSGLKIEVIPTAKFRKKGRGLLFSKALFEGLIFGEAYIRRDLSTEENLRFKIEWASLTVGSKFTVFALFYFVFEGNFEVQAPGGLIFGGGDLTEGFLCYRLGGLIFGGAYTWRGFCSEFYGTRVHKPTVAYKLVLQEKPQDRTLTYLL